MKYFLNYVCIWLICPKFGHFTKYPFLAFLGWSQLLKPNIVDSVQEGVLGVKLKIGLNLVRWWLVSLFSFAPENYWNGQSKFLSNIFQITSSKITFCGQSYKSFYTLGQIYKLVLNVLTCFFTKMFCQHFRILHPFN